ncbi:tetratricopeptide repeat protein [Kriegella sp. EG-1]|nr:tetratricopeptide repeat protein [Flavobacteriaceae bacterium EG-1]
MNFNEKTIFFIFYFLFISINLHSQNTKIDSLKVELQNLTIKDSTRVNVLNELAFSHFSKDMAKTLEYLDEAKTIAETIQFDKGKARNTYIKGITEAIQSNFRQALQYYNEALKLYEIINFKKGIANCYNAMGITFRNKGELRKSVSYYKKAIKIEEEIESDNLSASLLNLGTSYEVLGDYQEALFYLKKALTIAKAEENEERIAYSLNNLGGIYKGQSNYPLALEHYNKSLYINKKLGDSISVAHNLFNLGSIYSIQEQYDKAMSYFKKSIELYKRMDSKIGVSSILNGMGNIHEKNRQYKSALNLYLEALKINKQIGANGAIPNNLNNIGGVYLALKDYKTANEYFIKGKLSSIAIEDNQSLCAAYIGLSNTFTNQKNYKHALTNALNAKNNSEKFGFLDYQKDALEVLSKIYKATGNYKDALKSHQQFKILNDSLFNKENIEKITQLEYEYKYKQALDSANIRELILAKTVKTTSQNLEKSQRNFLLGIIAFLVVSLILGLIISVLKLRNEKAKIENILVEQKLLRSQMTPHFIFNSLAVLQGMILNKEQEKSISYLSKFSKLLRTTLENSRYKTVALSKELSAINNYMALQNLDASPPFNYNLIVASEIDATSFQIPSMLIQPFIENAIEHAFVAKKENKEIKVVISLKGKDLICTITDNGIGINKENKKIKKNKKSLATTITEERLKMISKDFKSKGEIRIEDRKKFGEHGTLVTLLIPYKVNLV